MKRIRMRVVFAFAVGIALGLLADTAIGKQHVKVSPLLKSDLAGNEGRVLMMAIAEFAPGIALPNHFHPGEELGHLMEGSGVLMMEGQPDKRLKQGGAFYIPSRKVHQARVSGTGLRMLSIRIHEKGQPIIVPVK